VFARSFRVTRKYEVEVERGVSKAAVRFDAATNTWHIPLGEKIRVTLGMSTHKKRSHIALMDSLPAGFEPLNAVGRAQLTTYSPSFNPWGSHRW
jgi:hypothetical protein